MSFAIRWRRLPYLTAARLVQLIRTRDRHALAEGLGRVPLSRVRSIEGALTQLLTQEADDLIVVPAAHLLFHGRTSASLRASTKHLRELLHTGIARVWSSARLRSTTEERRLWPWIWCAM